MPNYSAYHLDSSYLHYGTTGYDKKTKGLILDRKPQLLKFNLVSIDTFIVVDIYFVMYHALLYSFVYKAMPSICVNFTQS